MSLKQRAEYVMIWALTALIGGGAVLLMIGSFWLVLMLAFYRPEIGLPISIILMLLSKRRRVTPV